MRQFLEFAAENVIHAQRLRDFPGNVAVLGAPGIHVGFLQQNQVRTLLAEKLDYAVQLKSAVDVPTDNSESLRIGRNIQPLSKRYRLYLVHYAPHVRRKNSVHLRGDLVHGTTRSYGWCRNRALLC